MSQTGGTNTGSNNSNSNVNTPANSGNTNNGQNKAQVVQTNNINQNTTGTPTNTNNQNTTAIATNNNMNDQNNAQTAITTNNNAPVNNTNTNNTDNNAVSNSVATDKKKQPIEEWIDLVDGQIKAVDKTIQETKDKKQQAQLVYEKMLLLQKQLHLKQLQEQGIKDQALSTELYKIFKIQNKDNAEENSLQNCLTLLTNEVDKLDYNEKKKITQELGKYKDLDIKTQMQLVKEYLHTHPNMLKSDRQIRDEIDDLSRKNLSEIIDKNSKINDIVSKHKESMYQDIENESKFNEKIRKLNKEIYELDEQIGIWEKIKDIFGCSPLCDCMKEALEQKKALKNKKAILDWRVGSFDQQSINHDNALKTAIANTMNVSNDKNMALANNTVSKEKTMQILGYGKDYGGFKSAGLNTALISKKNSQGFSLDYVE